MASANMQSPEHATCGCAFESKYETGAIGCFISSSRSPFLPKTCFSVHFTVCSLPSAVQVTFACQAVTNLCVKLRVLDDMNVTKNIEKLGSNVWLIYTNIGLVGVID